VIAGLPDELRPLLRDEKVPTWRSPTLATLTDRRFSDPDWEFERKLDGVRGLAFRDRDQVRLMSRNRLSLNNTYPEIVEALAKQDIARFVVDGEIVAFEGRHISSPNRCMARRQAAPRPRAAHRQEPRRSREGDALTEVAEGFSPPAGHPPCRRAVPRGYRRGDTPHTRSAPNTRRRHRKAPLRPAAPAPSAT
jgi:hypothetical protein